MVHALMRRFTVREFERMGEAGILAEDERVELIEGEIVRMSPIGSRHADCVDRLMEWLVGRGAGKVRVRVQNPVLLDETSEPEPDVVLARRRPDFYAAGHPGPADILLLIEVADSTADYDRGVKVPLYARSGIPETWLVDLRAEVVEVYQAPERGRYTVRQSLHRGDNLPVPGLPDVWIGVEEILW